MNKKILIFIGILIGVALTSTLFLIFKPKGTVVDYNEASVEKKVLYWVAPMDPNYRRNKPGKSPMGMDLIPVYEESNALSDAGIGTITIAPELINNLGVRTDKVIKKPMISNLKTVGYIAFDEDLMVHIHPRVQGWVEKLFVRSEGETVSQGQPLYQIYSPELVNAQEEYLLALNRNNQRLVNAAQQKLRALQVPKTTIVSIKRTRKVNQYLTFYAPQSGIVQSLNIRQGHHVKPGTEIMSIGAIDKVWVEVEIFEKQLPWIQLGAAAEMQVGFLPGRKWLGSVDFIYPTLDSKTRTAKVRLKFPNQDLSLKPNMYATISIESIFDRESLFVPKEAVIRTGDQDRVVLALGQGRFKSIEVVSGMQNQNAIEIISGLDEGEEVVVSAQFLIDSESSKTSDFKRMQSQQEQSDPSSNTAIVDGIINTIDVDSRIINISRGPIEKWSRPAATMDFILPENIDIHLLKPAETIRFKFEAGEEFIILELIEKSAPTDLKQQHNHMHQQ